jgi:hypothetical protein
LSLNLAITVRFSIVIDGLTQILLCNILISSIYFRIWILNRNSRSNINRTKFFVSVYVLNLSPCMNISPKLLQTECSISILLLRSCCNSIFWIVLILSKSSHLFKPHLLIQYWNSLWGSRTEILYLLPIKCASNWLLLVSSSHCIGIVLLGDRSVFWSWFVAYMSLLVSPDHLSVSW